jgi:hypothetical protein
MAIQLADRFPTDPLLTPLWEPRSPEPGPALLELAGNRRTIQGLDLSIAKTQIAAMNPENFDAP